MTSHPHITWIMPAYNAAPYIGEAIGSVIAQTINDWELIVVNDGSTDETAEIASRLAAVDSRIRLLSTPTPSGSAFEPRKLGIMAAHTEIVAPLDADDTVGSDYLERLLNVMDRHKADIVYPQMCRADGTPAVKYAPGIAETPCEGRELVRHTLDGWHIACGGGLIKRDLYLKAFESFPKGYNYAFADELLTRHLLLYAPTVVATNVKYFYRTNEASISHRPTGKLFDFLLNNHRLLHFATEHFGNNSDEYLLAQRQNFHGIFDALRLLNRYSFTAADTQRAEEMIAVSRSVVDRHLLRGRVSPYYLMLLKLPQSISRGLLKIADSIKPRRNK